MIAKTIGPYHVLERLGAGGMGEVYRARDTKLNRDVAIKILPDAFASDADRVARFTREAQTLATLNHPHIAQIHGLEESSGVRALVMELVDGEDLAQRIARGAIPIDEALAIATQIADALEAAHEQGIIHRDLKPANIKLRPDGTVKVLDFGLAKVLEPASGSAPSSVSMSPTVTVGTQIGVILGTAAYMAPEQARGKPVDKRADIWAFACVLYEMLTGKAAFGGSDVTEILASVVKTEPDWAALPSSTPPYVRRLVERCLRKDPTRRLQHIGDARLELEDPPSPVTSESASLVRSRRPLGWIAAAVAFGLVAAFLGVVHFLEQPAAVRTTRFQIQVPDTFQEARDLSLSADGTMLAFVAAVGEKTQLFVRPLDSIAAQPLAGTEGAAAPFWSPDNRFVAFFAQGKLRKVEATGGPVQILCDAEVVGGGTWNADGTLLFANRHGLYRVASAGGVPNPVTSIDTSTEVAHHHPQFLPDGRHFIYQVLATAVGWGQSVVAASLDDQPDSKERRRLVSGTYGTFYSAGHLLYERSGVLMAQPFDPARLELRGEPVPIAQELQTLPGMAAPFSASLGGTLAYVAGARKTQLAWFDRAGRELQRVGETAIQRQPKLSADGNQLVVVRQDSSARWDAWLVDLTRGTDARFTFQGAAQAIWSPDGTRILFNWRRDGDLASSLYLSDSGRATNEQRLLSAPEVVWPDDWSRDGRFVLYGTLKSSTGLDLWALPLEGDRQPLPVAQAEFAEAHAQFSPDTRWVVYEASTSVGWEVYLQGFPNPGRRVQVSTRGGSRARWRRDGKEIFYLSTEGKMMAVDFRSSGATFDIGRPRELFQARLNAANVADHAYDVSADGQRFLINTTLDGGSAPPITMVTNWTARK